jgi:septal ring-binding cell division protein DamX
MIRPLMLGIGSILLFGAAGCSWLGGNNCDGPDCAASLLESDKAGRVWYCYGRQDQSWDCRLTADSSQIASVKPGAEVPFVMPQAVSTPPPPVAATVDPDESGVLQASTDELLEQPQDFFTVQLLALPDEAGIIEYARDHRLPSPLYARITDQGSTWFVLLLGIYPDQSAAEAARDEWLATDETAATKPAVRSLGPLQDAIRLALAGS